MISIILSIIYFYMIKTKNNYSLNNCVFINFHNYKQRSSNVINFVINLLKSLVCEKVVKPV